MTAPASIPALGHVNDDILAPLIRAEDDLRRREAIQEIVTGHAVPVLESLAARFRRSESLTPDESDELVSLVLLRVIRRLHAVPHDLDDAIAQFDNYVATLAYHVLYDMRRTRRPERTRLKNRLRYALKHDPRLALWFVADDLLCGLAQWNGRTTFARSIDIAPEAATSAMLDASRPADAVVALFRARPEAVPLDVLVSVFARLWTVRDVPAAPPPAASVEPEQLTALEGRESLERLWREIRLLPAGQRTALLLNLRDADGGNALLLFLVLGIATLPEIAEIAGVEESELTRIWDDLPMNDQAIARRLNTTRQQVINLRKSARARLARRTGHLK